MMLMSSQLVVLAFTSSIVLFPFVYAQVNLVPFVESVSIVEEAFQHWHCSVQEGALGNEISPVPAQWEGFINRKLVRFSVGIANKGVTDLKVDRRDHPEWFEWGSCHGHWHFKDFTNYELMDQDGNDVVTGRKQAFCLMDIRKVDQHANTQPQHSCNHPGISAGWADIYSYSLDAQWVDVTGVPPGNYTLRVTVNHGRMVDESSFSDNSFDVRDIVIPGGSSREEGLPPPTTSSPLPLSFSLRDIGSNQQCLPVDTDCSSNENCCSEICMHASGEIKTSDPGTGGTCVCMEKEERCSGDHNCCSGRCRVRNGRCRSRRNRSQPARSRSGVNATTTTIGAP